MMSGLRKLVIGFAVILFFQLYITSDTNAHHSKNGKFLVLGFKSKSLGDLQHRLLRERIMWDLQSAGFSIVPVMEFERIFRDKSEVYVRSLSRNSIRMYCIKFKADYAISGVIETKNINRDAKEIKPDSKYTCKIFLFNRDKDEFKVIQMDADGASNYFQFFVSLSKKIVSTLEKSIKQ